MMAPFTDREKRIGIVATLATAFIWAWPTIFIRALSSDFDIFTQSFYRYLAASGFFFAFGLLFVRQSLKTAFREARALVVPAVIVALFQMSQVTGVYMTNASVVGVASRVNVVFIVLFSYALFEEERRIVRSRHFLVANLFVLTGILGLVLGAENLELEFNLGIVFVVLGGMFWGAYIVSLKRIVHRVDALGALPLIQLFAALIFLPIVLLIGDLSQVTVVSLDVNLLLLGSGVFCVGLGNVTNYVAIRYLGATIPSNILTFKPILTIVFAYLVLGEVLTLPQIASGLALLLGCWIIIAKVVSRYEHGDQADDGGGLGEGLGEITGPTF